MSPPEVRFDVPLGALTTLGVGGPAWALAEVPSEDRLTALLAWAEAEQRPAWVLAGGSNLLVSDEGHPGLALRLTGRALKFIDEGRTVQVVAEAGASWDELVQTCVDRDLAGVECLSGIPGQVGAAPIQNIGAYGQELAETLVSVRAFDRSTHKFVQFDKPACGFGYRDSHFKQNRDAFIVTEVRLRLSKSGAPALRYGELQKHFAGRTPSLLDVRQAVLQIRRNKSMVLDPSDGNTKSAGSFFTNPIVSRLEAQAVAAHAQSQGLGIPPCYPAPKAQVKLSAAWLIERSGFKKGHTQGAAGLSTQHCLALINRGGAHAEDLVALAAQIRQGVQERFNVTLVPEPVFVGFSRSVGELLDV